MKAYRKQRSKTNGVQRKDATKVRRQSREPASTPNEASKAKPPAQTGPEAVLSLQRALGNQAVQRVLQQRVLQQRVLQTKLNVGPADDQYEQEADQVADQVMNKPADRDAQPQEMALQTTPLRRQEEEEELQTLRRQEEGEELQTLRRQEEEEEVQTLQRQEEEEEIQTLQRQEEEEELQTSVQRQEEEEEVQTLQRQEEEEEVQTLQRQEEEEEVQALQRRGDAPAQVSAETEDRLLTQKQGGRPLPKEARAFMESRFGVDFSAVRVHVDGEAAKLSHELNAQAFTHGADIFFASGRYDPNTDTGKRLLAHELAHVVQQGAAKPKKVQQPKKVKGKMSDVRASFQELLDDEFWAKSEKERVDALFQTYVQYAQDNNFKFTTREMNDMPLDAKMGNPVSFAMEFALLVHEFLGLTTEPRRFTEVLGSSNGGFYTVPLNQFDFIDRNCPGNLKAPDGSYDAMRRLFFTDYVVVEIPGVGIYDPLTGLSDDKILRSVEEQGFVRGDRGVYEKRTGQTLQRITLAERGHKTGDGYVLEVIEGGAHSASGPGAEPTEGNGSNNKNQ